MAQQRYTLPIENTTIRTRLSVFGELEVIVPGDYEAGQLRNQVYGATKKLPGMTHTSKFQDPVAGQLVLRIWQDPNGKQDGSSLSHERLFTVTTWSAGWNTPSYIPEVEPVLFADWQDAHGFLHQEVQTRWDQAQQALDPDDDSTEDTHPDAIYLEVDVAFGTATQGEGFSTLTGDGKVQYWIEPVEEVITLARLEAIYDRWQDEFQAMIEDGSEWNIGSLSAGEIAPLFKWKRAHEAVELVLTLSQDPTLRFIMTPEFTSAVNVVADMYKDLIVDAIVTMENEDKDQ